MIDKTLANISLIMLILSLIFICFSGAQGTSPFNIGFDDAGRATLSLLGIILGLGGTGIFIYEMITKRS